MSAKDLSEVNGYHVHPTADVEAGAQIGEGTRIFHHAQVMSRARVGKNCTIGRSSCIHDGVWIGDGCNIQNYITIPEGVVLEENVFCPAHTVFTNVHNPRATISRKHEYRQTYVEHDVSLGANCTIVCGVRIGAYAMVGAGAVVTKDVRAHALVVGVPARQVGWVTRTGIVFRKKDLTQSYYMQELKKTMPAFICQEEPGTIYAIDDRGEPAWPLGRLFVVKAPPAYVPEEVEEMERVAHASIVEAGSIFHDGRSRPEEAYDEIDKQLDELDEGGPDGPVAQQQRVDHLVSANDDVEEDILAGLKALDETKKGFLSKHDPGEESKPTPVYSRVWDPCDDFVALSWRSWSVDDWVKDAIIYAGRASAYRVGESFWKGAFEALKEKYDAATAAPVKPASESYEDMVTELLAAEPRTPEQFRAAADALEASPIGTAEEERSRAKMWMTDAGRYCHDANHWRKKYQALCDLPLSYETGQRPSITTVGPVLSDADSDELSMRLHDIVEGLQR